jgi:(E)-4-hydroxy-3-methyl-but-2-enyl pyrophosphate reductase
MNILIDESAGFCSGVRFAVETARQVAKRKDVRIYCLGDIIHNNDVINELKTEGIITVESVSQIAEEGSVVIIRAHGIGKDIYRQIKDKNLEIVDATCAYVKKIQELAQENHDLGRKIILTGDKCHPEIAGISGWCGNEAFIVENEDDVDIIPFSKDAPISVFSQTTFEKNKYRNIVDKIKISFKNVEEFDTICKSTIKRQKKAEELSKECDVMIILGGERSSNTRKLYDICASNCQETYLAENLSKLPKDLQIKNKKVGITAGASTPANVIEEVYNFMSESSIKENEVNFEDAISQASLKLSSGTIVKGKVLRKSDTEITIDVSYKSDGVLPIEEFSDPEEFAALKPGDETEVYVTRVNDAEGYVLLSKKRVDAIRSVDSVKNAFEDKKPLAVKVKNAVKGGVVAGYKGFEIFIPASQIGDTYTKDLSTFVGSSFDILITEFDPQKRRVIGSRKVLADKDRDISLNAFWDTVRIGMSYEGIVKSFVDFGAFVNLGPIDGLLHISEISWSSVRHPSDILKIGQKINVFILSFDKDKRKVSLGYKKNEDNPWFNVSQKISVNDEIEARIVRIVPFGAFAEIVPGVEGLIHISNISGKRLGHPAEVLKIDQTVRVKVLEVDPVNKRIALSIKDLLPPAEEIHPSDVDETHTEELDVTIGDIVDLKKQD